MFRLFAPLAAALFLAGSAQAVSLPATLSVLTGESAGFRFPFVHDATKLCETIGGVEFCMSGDVQDMIDPGQVLTGVFDTVSEILTLDGGQTLTIAGATDVQITGGTIDLGELGDGVETDVFVGTFETSSHGTFHILDHLFYGPASSYDEPTQKLYLWGNNWDNVGPPDSGAFEEFGIDLGLMLMVPEPGTAALLMLAGAMAIGLQRRRAD